MATALVTMVVSEGAINNIMGGMENTAGVRLHSHRHKLKQRFDIIRKLGQGTYGKVQLAVNKETGQEVAIKTIKKAKIETEQDLIRIRREIQIMSSVQHPHIIHIYEVFENREKMVLVMEYAAGGELYDYLSERKVLPEEEARRVFRQVSSAVYYCHKHKICHRDLKLENILLDLEGNAKIADFGLSNVFDEKHRLDTFCGSPLYASPEIVKGIPYEGPEVDCWSLGVLLYTLVYGAMPFDGSNFRRLVKQITQGDYYEPATPARSSDLIKHMLMVNSLDRATVEDICGHWWVNEGYPESCLTEAEILASQTPVRLDLLLSLAPKQISSEHMLIQPDEELLSELQPSSEIHSPPPSMVQHLLQATPARSQSLGALPPGAQSEVEMLLEKKKLERKMQEEKKRQAEDTSLREKKKKKESDSVVHKPPSHPLDGDVSERKKLGKEGDKPLKESGERKKKVSRKKEVASESETSDRSEKDVRMKSSSKRGEPMDLVERKENGTGVKERASTGNEGKVDNDDSRKTSLGKVDNVSDAIDSSIDAVISSDGISSFTESLGCSYESGARPKTPLRTVDMNSEDSFAHKYNEKTIPEGKKGQEVDAENIYSGAKPSVFLTHDKSLKSSGNLSARKSPSYTKKVPSATVSASASEMQLTESPDVKDSAEITSDVPKVKSSESVMSLSDTEKILQETAIKIENAAAALAACSQKEDQDVATIRDASESGKESASSSHGTTPARSRASSESSAEAKSNRSETSSRRQSKIFSKAALFDSMAQNQTPPPLEKPKKVSRPGGLSLTDIAKKFEEKLQPEVKKKVVAPPKVVNEIKKTFESTVDSTPCEETRVSLSGVSLALSSERIPSRSPSSPLHDKPKELITPNEKQGAEKVNEAISKAQVKTTSMKEKSPLNARESLDIKPKLKPTIITTTTTVKGKDSISPAKEVTRKKEGSPAMLPSERVTPPQGTVKGTFETRNHPSESKCTLTLENKSSDIKNVKSEIETKKSAIDNESSDSSDSESEAEKLLRMLAEKREKLEAAKREKLRRVNEAAQREMSKREKPAIVGEVQDKLPVKSEGTSLTESTEQKFATLPRGFKTAGLNTRHILSRPARPNIQDVTNQEPVETESRGSPEEKRPLSKPYVRNVPIVKEVGPSQLKQVTSPSDEEQYQNQRYTGPGRTEVEITIRSHKPHEEVPRKPSYSEVKLLPQASSLVKDKVQPCEHKTEGPPCTPLPETSRGMHVEPHLQRARRERIIPIMLENDGEKPAVPSAPTVSSIQKSGSRGKESSSSSLSSGSLRSALSAAPVAQPFTAVSPEPIRKSRRERIIPIAVEGEGVITPPPGSDSVSRRDKESPHFSRDTSYVGGRERKLEKTESFSSAGEEEEEDDDGFQILTAESLFSTLLSRVRSLTRKMTEDGRVDRFRRLHGVDVQSSPLNGTGTSGFWSSLNSSPRESLSRHTSDSFGRANVGRDDEPVSSFQTSFTRSMSREPSVRDSVFTEPSVSFSTLPRGWRSRWSGREDGEPESSEMSTKSVTRRPRYSRTQSREIPSSQERDDDKRPRSSWNLSSGSRMGYSSPLPRQNQESLDKSAATYGIVGRANSEVPLNGNRGKDSAAVKSGCSGEAIGRDGGHCEQVEAETAPVSSSSQSSLNSTANTYNQKHSIQQQLRDLVKELEAVPSDLGASYPHLFHSLSPNGTPGQEVKGNTLLELDSLMNASPDNRGKDKDANGVQGDMPGDNGLSLTGSGTHNYNSNSLPQGSAQRPQSVLSPSTSYKNSPLTGKQIHKKALDTSLEGETRPVLKRLAEKTRWLDSNSILKPLVMADPIQEVREESPERSKAPVSQSTLFSLNLQTETQNRDNSCSSAIVSKSTVPEILTPPELHSPLLNVTVDTHADCGLTKSKYSGQNLDEDRASLAPPACVSHNEERMCDGQLVVTRPISSVYNTPKKLSVEPYRRGRSENLKNTINLINNLENNDEIHRKSLGRAYRGSKSREITPAIEAAGEKISQLNSSTLRRISPFEAYRRTKSRELDSVIEKANSLRFLDTRTRSPPLQSSATELSKSPFERAKTSFEKKFEEAKLPAESICSVRPCQQDTTKICAGDKGSPVEVKESVEKNPEGYAAAAEKDKKDIKKKSCEQEKPKSMYRMIASKFNRSLSNLGEESKLSFEKKREKEEQANDKSDGDDKLKLKHPSRFLRSKAEKSSSVSSVIESQSIQDADNVERKPSKKLTDALNKFLGRKAEDNSSKVEAKTVANHDLQAVSQQNPDSPSETPEKRKKVPRFKTKKFSKSQENLNHSPVLSISAERAQSVAPENPVPGVTLESVTKSLCDHLSQLESDITSRIGNMTFTTTCTSATRPVSSVASAPSFTSYGLSPALASRRATGSEDCNRRPSGISQDQFSENVHSFTNKYNTCSESSSKLDNMKEHNNAIRCQTRNPSSPGNETEGEDESVMERITVKSYFSRFNETKRKPKLTRIDSRESIDQQLAAAKARLLQDEKECCPKNARESLSPSKMLSPVTQTTDTAGHRRFGRSSVPRTTSLPPEDNITSPAYARQDRPMSLRSPTIHEDDPSPFRVRSDQPYGTQTPIRPSSIAREIVSPHRLSAIQQDSSAKSVPQFLRDETLVNHCTPLIARDGFLTIRRVPSVPAEGIKVRDLYLTERPSACTGSYYSGTSKVSSLLSSYQNDKKRLSVTRFSQEFETKDLPSHDSKSSTTASESDMNKNSNTEHDTVQEHEANVKTTVHDAVIAAGTAAGVAAAAAITEKESESSSSRLSPTGRLKTPEPVKAPSQTTIDQAAINSAREELTKHLTPLTRLSNIGVDPSVRSYRRTITAGRLGDTIPSVSTRVSVTERPTYRRTNTMDIASTDVRALGSAYRRNIKDLSWRYSSSSRTNCYSAVKP